MRKILLIVLLTILSFDVLKADNLSGIDIKSESGIIMEASTGKILFDKNMDEQKSPASMTKIMTMLLTVEAIESGKISLDDEVNISANASKMGGSQVYLEENSTATVEMLLKSIAIGSANDASVAVAEKIGGTESNFVNMMNKRAKELGAVNTTFKNPHGLDEEGHLTTAHDLALIARELIKHKEILKLTSTYETTITHKNGKSLWLVNTNKLIKFYNGLDGLKTGFTDNAGYCLTGTMLRNDMRLITVTMKAPTKEDRNTDTINLMEYAYSMYYKSTLIKKDKKIGDMFIDNAKKRKISYYLKEDASVILDKDVRNIKYNYSVKLNNVKAPLKKNDVVGTLTLHLNNQDINYNLIVKENIKKSNYFVRLNNYLKDIINGNLNVLP
ncbi:serine-type D-Ala-D-Ala carboxypeptidase [Clostridium sp. CAG:628]|mgnify:FL=1|nr:serine-type D-Ala-D-Ala carboxypeptidase [Clostridium sp. CAG:628]